MDGGSDIVRELRARESLRDLIGSYCRAADNCETERLKKLFHPEGLVDSGVIRAKPKEFSERFVAWLKQNTVSIFHAICGMQFEVSGDQATGDIQVLALCQMKPAHGDKRIITAGRYADKYVIHEGRWVISERIFSPELSWDFPAPIDTTPQGK